MCRALGIIGGNINMDETGHSTLLDGGAQCAAIGSGRT